MANPSTAYLESDDIHAFVGKVPGSRSVEQM
jgi:hypothetical protein